MTPRPPISTLFPYTTLFRSATRRNRASFCIEDLIYVFARPFRLSSFVARKMLAVPVDNRSRSCLAPFQCVKARSEEHTSELQSLRHLVCRLLLEKKKTTKTH